MQNESIGVWFLIEDSGVVYFLSTYMYNLFCLHPTNCSVFVFMKSRGIKISTQGLHGTNLYLSLLRSTHFIPNQKSTCILFPSTYQCLLPSCNSNLRPSLVILIVSLLLPSTPVAVYNNCLDNHP